MSVLAPFRMAYLTAGCRGAMEMDALGPRTCRWRAGKRDAGDTPRVRPYDSSTQRNME